MRNCWGEDSEVSQEKESDEEEEQEEKKEEEAGNSGDLELKKEIGLFSAVGLIIGNVTTT
jgi:hypothetical protein